MTWVSSASSPRVDFQTRSSMADRNAASVLPEPVGAAIKVCRPDLIAGQASACGSVGAVNCFRNHSRTAGWNELSGFMGRAVYHVCNDVLRATTLRGV